ncbi:hypothetical protein CUROG_06340 [Corynebacterium urogenitale]|uniref:Uncharacterized protein n=1 Tax=Corynebacterium urogenitale TaxID=2487892 RepID=A0A5J6ZCN3_9CORY|nr:hypothetical protein CUROG_06340 [Corynebacterium urogenitale]
MDLNSLIYARAQKGSELFAVETGAVDDDEVCSTGVPQAFSRGWHMW